MKTNEPQGDYKKYSDLLNKAEYATGRKGVVGLLKKAAKLKSQIEIN